MNQKRNAKIIATLGPASATTSKIRALYEAGADVFRLNFSHGTHEDHLKSFQIIRQLEVEVRRPIGVLMDLQGPKLRIGTFKGGNVQLVSGEVFCLDMDETPGTDKRVCLKHPEIFEVLEPGLLLLLDDGRIRLEVMECGKGFAVTEVKVGGRLSDRKGVNFPGVRLPISALTEKDRKDLAFGLELGVDWVALSFVQKPEDVEELRTIVGNKAGILSKLEKPAALEGLDRIVDLSDAIMVARGDLGVEIPAEEVPRTQKDIVRVCRHAGTPVVVATQMLESMVSAPTPTRAEATDVATAIYDGVDAVMLSAESAAGEFPVEAVAMMERIIRRTEADPLFREMVDAFPQDPTGDISGAICAAMNSAAQVLPLAAVVCYTESGYTTQVAARERPRSPILCLTPNASTARRMRLVWGVSPVIAEAVGNVHVVVEIACSLSVREEFASPGDHVLIIAGMPFGQKGSTNLLRIAQIDLP